MTQFIPDDERKRWSAVARRMWHEGHVSDVRGAWAWNTHGRSERWIERGPLVLSWSGAGGRPSFHLSVRVLAPGSKMVRHRGSPTMCSGPHPVVAEGGLLVDVRNNDGPWWGLVSAALAEIEAELDAGDERRADAKAAEVRQREEQRASELAAAVAACR